MNRTDRLYALVEELRAFAPRTRTARQLADRFEVSVRTVERDLNSLLQAGVPIYATPGPGGGYSLDKSHTLPPVNFTPEEATALAVALSRPGASPFADSLRSAVRKVVGVMPAQEAEAARRLAGRVRLFAHASDTRASTDAVIEEAVLGSLVVEIEYQDRNDTPTTREVEPLGLVGSAEAWYLAGYCRLRKDERAFKLDRIVSARLTGERAEDRGDPTLDVPHALRRVTLLE
ncbi:MAG TPA: YafY family protein [Acidimicrobiales bacterium]